ncbi:hypothetical protein GOP47_0013650 [Adiantum capillus-veneris]|uniref:60S ribosome subunit biogenesis protein NIP7 pre-PUA domain-containing protein n=1 Tax=Adiantum capillus-veneris TaxID=13818 RepID=A0A9D4UPF8_ADICA|nr:hypothetical protein GOP47_0013650 [Adiantum capillus-veneris]
MRPLDEQETTAVFEKLHKFVGSNLKHLIERPAVEGAPNATTPLRYCFRLHKSRVFYASEALVKKATNISREKLVGLGTCIGKFTKSENCNSCVVAPASEKGDHFAEEQFWGSFEGQPGGDEGINSVPCLYHLARFHGMSDTVSILDLAKIGINPNVILCP